MAVMIVKENSSKKKSFARWQTKSWGNAPAHEYSAEEFESIRSFSDSRGGFLIDDITWNDCSFDDIYLLVNNTVSSCGEDVLYSWMRHPVFHQEELDERNRLIEYFSSHQNERSKVQFILAGVGRMRLMSFYNYICQLKEAKHLGKMKFILVGVLTLAGIILLFIHPLAGLAVLVPALFINLAVYLNMKDSTQGYIRSFQCVLRLMNGANAVARLSIPELSDYGERLKKSADALASFRRGSFFVTSGGQVGTGLGDAVLEYLKMFFHIDLIKFDQMLDAYAGHEAECTEMLQILGTLDAAIACASFRKYLPQWCRGEFVPFDSGEVSFSVSEMYHPMISNPVANSIETTGGNLVTGSNASGKSTFLKNTAICAVLAQSIDTVPAAAYRANFLRVFTSMALTDNLSKGESYFIVEIKSLKRILDAASGEHSPVLGIIDEVLRGTNTIERIAASSQILKTLIKGNVLAFAATHDIELSYILEKLYTNWHFEEEVSDNDVVFNYQLKSGRAVSRNAIKLLGIAGYSPAIVEQAKEEAERFEKTGEWSL